MVGTMKPSQAEERDGILKPSQAEEERFSDGILKPSQAEERLILLGFDPRTSCKPQQEECSFTTYTRWQGPRLFEKVTVFVERRVKCVPKLK